MKFSTSKQELQTALQKVSKATPTRSTLPILNCVLIETSHSKTILRSTDLELTIDCDLGKLYAKEDNKEVLISNFTPNKRVHLGARIGNWRIKAVVKKSYYFVS